MRQGVGCMPRSSEGPPDQEASRVSLSSDKTKFVGTHKQAQV